jgi:uncharacterized protein YqjF (DUF2071 family)
MGSPKPARRFLTAGWRKLILANYAVDPQCLADYLPHGTVLDFWNGACYVSLVGFMFTDTAVKGIRIPYHVHFEEVNLRFYVKRGEKRGVTFISEIVPRPALAFVANTLYGEKYETLRMRHSWDISESELAVKYGWRKSGNWNSIEARAALPARDIAPNSEAEFITEHFWGYTKISGIDTMEYEVVHPRWQDYEVLDYKIEVDFAAVYGGRFGFLTGQKPVSVMLAEGSEIAVRHGRRLR